MKLNFSDTEIAFRSRSSAELKQARLLFRSFNSSLLMRLGPRLLEKALVIPTPLNALVKGTLFKHFCGGESIEDCLQTAKQLDKFRVRSILDYSVEGQETEAQFERATAETLKTIGTASGVRFIAFAVFKVTGLAPFALLEAKSTGRALTKDEELAWRGVEERVERLAERAARAGVRLLIDAEETWIQPAIDQLAEDLMARYNREDVVVYNTLQMYRHDRLNYLKDLTSRASASGFKVGAKLVRGAYMEKERLRALDFGYPSPIHDTKEGTDQAFDQAVRFGVEHIDRVSLFVGTHNEESTRLLTELMADAMIPMDDRRVEFSQLFGMSDHLTYNLADAGFNVSKYLPYGPLRKVLPYLTRRAEENSSIKGQAARELMLIETELRRRRSV